MRTCVVAKDASIADNWHVLGMRGTGSVDFAVDDVFVPAEMTYAASARTARGGRLYRTGIIGYLGYPLPPSRWRSQAGTRRADDHGIDPDVWLHPAADARQRATFQHFLGEADVRLAAARALMLARGIDLMDAVELRPTS